MTMRFDGEIHVGFILTSYPENLEKLKKHNPSFSRIFYHYDIEKLETEEIMEFYRKCFDEVNISVDEQCLNLMTKYCYGFPLMMQELGENIFWSCEEDNVDIDLVINSIRNTNLIIADKYLDSLVKEDTYRKILDKISKKIIPNEDEFSISQLKENTTDEEKDLIDMFINEAVDEGIILRQKYVTKDKCVFANPLYSIYLKNKNL